MIYYIAIAFILLMGIAIWKILRWTCRLLKNGIQTIIDAVNVRNYERKCPTPNFPKEDFPRYSIDQNEFSRISTRTAYRHKRIENVDVVENTVSITIVSQTGLSKSHAKMTFSLSGRNIGSFQIKRDNFDTTIPEKIAEKIRNEIRKQVGLEV